ncbi:hypothetical protein [Spirosoma arcticum]
MNRFLFLYLPGAILLLVNLLSCRRTDETSTPAAVTPAILADRRISPEGLSYQDIEIDNARKTAVYLRGETSEIWLANLNAANGGFALANGADLRMATGAAPFNLNNVNGPEFGDNANGWGVYYTKTNGSVYQLWRSTPDATTATETPLTTGNLLRSGVLASTNRQLSQTRLIYIRKTDNKIMWSDENNPTAEVELPGAVAGVSGPRSLPNSPDIVFCTTNGQIARYSTATKTVQTLTNDSGTKTDAFGWLAPEYGGDLLLFAIVDQTRLAVYKNNGGAFWERIKTLTVDPTSNHPYVYSAEPFVGNGGTKSYFSLHQQRDKLTPPLQTDASVWVWGLDGTRKRCDNGAAGRRLDPEFFYGATEIHLLYNLIVPAAGGNRWEAWSCGTGIRP